MVFEPSKVHLTKLHMGSNNTVVPPIINLSLLQ